MDAKEYEYLKNSEKSWWYRARVFFVLRMLSGISLPEIGRVLDFGAGYGGMYQLLSGYGVVDAYEVEPAVAEACRTRGYGRVITNETSLEKGAYRMVGAFDVIEHIDDDVQATETVYSLLVPGGIFVATVPAFSFLWSEHDELNHHFRRYSLPEIKKLFIDAGFQNVRATYWNMLLFPIAYLMRLFGKGGGEALTPHPVVNRVLSELLRFESSAVPFTTLPFGTSIVVVGRKPKDAHSLVIEDVVPPVTWKSFLNPVFIFASLFNARILHFLTAGATGALLNIGLTWFFTEYVFGIQHYLDAFAIGIAGNLACNFTLNSIVTFRTKKKHLRRFVWFVLYSLFVAWLIYGTVGLITPLVGLQWYLVVISAVILAYSAFNFLFFKYVLFKEMS